MTSFNKEETNMNNIEKCANSQKLPIFQFLTMVSGSLNLVCSGILYGWASASIPKLLHEDSKIPITNDEGSWLAAVLLIGTIGGSILSAIFLDKLGRKSVMIISSCLLIIAWTIIAFATNLSLLILGRIIGGLADGAIDIATAIYFGEISSPNVRGLLNGFITVAYTMGLVIVCIVGFYADMFTIALIALIFPVLSLLSLFWLPESPYYLIMKKRYAAAKHSIHRFQPDINVEREFARLHSAVTSQITNTGKFVDLFTVKSNRKGLYITLGARSIQQLSGMCAILFYAETIIKESADNPILFKYGPMLYFSTQAIVVIISSLIVDRAGRRPLLLFSLSGVCLMLLCQSCYFSVKNLTSVDVRSYEIIPTIALIFYVITFSIGMETIPLTLIAEIFPTNVKAFAVGMSEVCFSIFAIITTKLFQFTKDEFGLHVSYFFFLICSILGCIFIYFFVPETKGKTLEEIQQKLNKK